MVNVNDEKGLQIDRKASKNQNCLKLWPGHTVPPTEFLELVQSRCCGKSIANLNQSNPQDPDFRPP